MRIVCCAFRKIPSGTFPPVFFFVKIPPVPLSYPRGDCFTKKTYIPPRGVLRGYHRSIVRSTWSVTRKYVSVLLYQTRNNYVNMHLPAVSVLKAIPQTKYVLPNLSSQRYCGYCIIAIITLGINGDGVFIETSEQLLFLVSYLLQNLQKYGTTLVPYDL